VIEISKSTSTDGGHQRVAFDIGYGTRRISCSLTTNFQKRLSEKKRYFYANRPLIEQRARRQFEQRGVFTASLTFNRMKIRTSLEDAPFPV
jgi:hypothetical protein